MGGCGLNGRATPKSPGPSMVTFHSVERESPKGTGCSLDVRMYAECM